MAVQTRTLRALLLWATFLCPAVAVIAGLFAATWPIQRGLIFYVAPLFFIGPLWLRLRLDERGLGWGTLWSIDLGIFFLAVLRFATGPWLPFSGHMLFLTYSALTTTSAPYRALAFALALETAWFKFVLWHDPRTFWFGLAGGAVAALVFVLVRRGQANQRVTRG